MSRATVYFVAGASAMVDVEIEQGDMDDGELRDALLEAAYEALDTTLCNHCAGHVDLGDFEVEAEPFEITP